MRELETSEVDQVSGGFVGTPIPFYNGFIPAPNWPGGFPSAIGMSLLAYNIGHRIGSWMNREISSQYGMSTGAALYYTVN